MNWGYTAGANGKHFSKMNEEDLRQHPGWCGPATVAFVQRLAEIMQVKPQFAPSINAEYGRYMRRYGIRYIYNNGKLFRQRVMLGRVIEHKELTDETKLSETA